LFPVHEAISAENESISNVLAVFIV